jgi:hypothetical protein
LSQVDIYYRNISSHGFFMSGMKFLVIESLLTGAVLSGCGIQSRDSLGSTATDVFF